MPETLEKPLVRSTLLHPAPLAFWLLIQLLTLLIPVFQIPLSDQFPAPAEKMAVAELVSVQLAMAAGFAPFFFRTRANSVCVVAAAWPMLQLAGFLSATSVLYTSIYVSLWLIVFSLLTLSVRGLVRATAYLNSVLVAFTVGGGLLAYLNAEFVPDSRFSTFPHGLVFGPIPSALTILSPNRPSTAHWLVISVITGISASIYSVFCWKRTKRSVD